MVRAVFDMSPTTATVVADALECVIDNGTD